MRVDFKVVSETRVYEGNIFDVFSDDVLLPNGNTAGREYLRHSGSVAILPVDNDGNVFLIEQFRYPAKGNILEVPAGTLGKDEERDECAARELTEETGLRAGRMEMLMTFFLCPGYSDEQITLYRATELERTEMNLDENEMIEVRSFSLDDCLEMIADGRIADAKTIVALQYEGMVRNG